MNEKVVFADEFEKVVFEDAHPKVIFGDESKKHTFDEPEGIFDFTFDATFE